MCKCESCKHGNADVEQPEECVSCIHEISRIGDGLDGFTDNYVYQDDTK